MKKSVDFAGKRWYISQALERAQRPLKRAEK
nr:MAG TPA: hypothetical protein [Caudoviricetes sp.]